MPRAAFDDLWSTLHSEKDWEGIVKNLRKDGRYYWVYTYITAIKKDGKTVGYSAARRPARQEELVRVIPYYRKLLSKEEQASFVQPLIDI
jgi:aerotaxis receptor